MSRAFPDIACRANAVVMDDDLGITVDGKAASFLKSRPAIETAGPPPPVILKDKTPDVQTPAHAPSENAQSFRKSLEAVRRQAEPRAQGEGFGDDFISFDTQPTDSRGKQSETENGEAAAEGKKRKRSMEGGKDKACGSEVSAAALQVDKRSPWARGQRYASGNQDRTVDLHNEILDFVSFIKPTKSEIKRRETLVDHCRAIVNELWPTAKLEVYGSYGSGMYLPSSDIDMVVLECPDENPFCLRKLASVIKADENFDKVQLIEKARVPIIKWEDVPSGIPLNVCFGQEDGLVNTEWIKQHMKLLQPLQPLLLVLKQFLYNRDLNETYTGGVGSYLLTMTIISFLQHHPGNADEHKSTCFTGTKAGMLTQVVVLPQDEDQTFDKRKRTWARSSWITSTSMAFASTWTAWVFLRAGGACTLRRSR
jgi:hypothetical protein